MWNKVAAAVLVAGVWLANADSLSEADQAITAPEQVVQTAPDDKVVLILHINFVYPAFQDLHPIDDDGKLILYSREFCEQVKDAQALNLMQNLMQQKVDHYGVTAYCFTKKEYEIHVAEDENRVNDSADPELKVERMMKHLQQHTVPWPGKPDKKGSIPLWNQLEV